MNGMKGLLLVAVGAGAIYWAKNVKITVSGAEAYDHEVVEAVGEDSQEEWPEEVVETRTQKRRPATLTKPEMSERQVLLQLIRERKLCEFIDYARNKGISDKEKFQVLGESLGQKNISELDVFLNFDLDQWDRYESEMAKAMILANQIDAFKQVPMAKRQEFGKGLSEKHQEILRLTEQMRLQYPDNLFYQLIKNDVYYRYRDVSDSVQEEIYQQTLNTDYYENPVFRSFRDIFLRAKNNVVQFYYFAKVLSQLSVEVDRYFIQRTYWFHPGVEVRDHIAELLNKNLENNSDGVGLYGYESNVYKVFQAAVPYEIYETLPSAEVFDQSRSQPVYSLEQLRLALDDKCDQRKVNELAIKLRAL